MDSLASLSCFAANRRGDCPFFEQHLVPNDAERAALAGALSGLRDRVAAQLDPIGVACDWPEPTSDDGVLAAFAATFNGIALALQRAGGHRVGESGHATDGVSGGVWAWFEFEHDALARPAAELSLRLIAEAVPEIDVSDILKASGAHSSQRPVEQAVRAFVEKAGHLMLPRDTEAIMRAARRFGIPCAQLERHPFIAPGGESRIRPNGLLMLGHGAHEQLIDGTFCFDRSERWLPLLYDRQALRQKLVDSGFAVPRQDPDAAKSIMTRRLLRAASAIAYPVVIKPGERGKGRAIARGISTPEQFRDALERVRRGSGQVVVEAEVPGKTHRLVIAAGRALGLVVDGAEREPGTVHPDTIACAERLSRNLETALMVVKIVTPDIARPLDEVGGAAVDLDLAPELDGFLPQGSGLLESACESLVRWLFPEGSACRIPIVAVTGTNGKTTTTRMIARIARAAGRRTALGCSDGIYVDGNFEAGNKAGAGTPYQQLLGRRDVDFAVLEEWFGRICRGGFAYFHSDVAVCLNVTNDHLGRLGVHTVEQMAQVKESVVARAREAAVLNADDPLCLAMAPGMRARRVGLASTGRLASLARNPGIANPCYCTVEKHEGADWLTIRDNDRDIPVIAVNEIPATFGGVVDYNISNAAHAALAAYFAGLPLEAIRAGLSSFAMNHESTPGRLNFYRELPFDVIMDYAHNLAGFRALTAFIDRQECAGRKIVMVAIAGDRRDDDAREAAAALAGHFDLYICRNYSGTRGRPVEEIPALIREGLLAEGVEKAAITEIPDSEAAIDSCLDLARPGDLLILLSGNDEFELIWQKLLQREAAQDGRAMEEERTS